MAYKNLFTAPYPSLPKNSQGFTKAITAVSVCVCVECYLALGDR